MHQSGKLKNTAGNLEHCKKMAKFANIKIVHNGR